MAGFEVIVRPVVLPNIRPNPPRVLAPPSDPSQGIAVLNGGGGNFVGISSNFSASVSRQQPHHESKRQYNTERVYQKDEEGKQNKKNYVDVERLRKVRLETSDGPVKVIYNDPPPADNIETIAADMVRAADPGAQ